ncbi:diphosphomevalonate decarboxylase [Liquorilactobacillus mali]|uniref:diphosphomevalonate decarboxylase n=1 Tax=Liquorilactobacillus mali TaxID=1618 RepID=UPI002953B942|nr:diphosphomevalonate decarboxylase [Liquorilactobacillus mali]MDV7757926.1 diphosphomevalonate decarboxylase [Liquorilactobacillus mali]
MNATTYTARAHTNIALIKYWGKKDEELILPMNNSLSLTLDRFYTETSVTFDEQLKDDLFLLDGSRENGNKVSKFLDIVRKKAEINIKAKVISQNHVPSTAGLASSASAYAALALAASKAAGLSLDKKELSRLARRGSGSACRSIYGGLVEWQEGTDDQTSFAYPIEMPNNFEITMVTLVINADYKKISSRAGMKRVVETSPYYPAWVQTAAKDLKNIKQAIVERDFETFGEIAEENAMKMHALNMSAHPHFNYLEPNSIKAMQIVEKLRLEGVSCYYTLDAGPNVKVICLKRDVKVIADTLSDSFGQEKVLVAGPGPAAHLI